MRFLFSFLVVAIRAHGLPPGGSPTGRLRIGRPSFGAVAGPEPGSPSNANLPGGGVITQRCGVSASGRSSTLPVISSGVAIRRAEQLRRMERV